jgi:ActR/RegA family two-component response regulator
MSSRADGPPEKEQYEVLVIEDDDADWALIERALARSVTARFNAHRVAHLNNGLTALRHRRYDAILLDLLLQYDGPANGLDTVVAVMREAADTPIVVLSSLADIEVAVQSVQFGASSFLEKPPDPARLESTLRQVIERFVKEEVSRRLTYESLSRLLETDDAPALGLLVGGHLDSIETALHHIRNYLANSSPLHATEIEKILGWGHVFSSIADIRNMLRLSSPTERDTVPPPAAVQTASATNGDVSALVSSAEEEFPRWKPVVTDVRRRRAISERALQKIQEISTGQVGLLTADDARAFLLSLQGDR